MTRFHQKVIAFSLLAEHHTSPGVENVRLSLMRLPGGHLLINMQAIGNLTLSYGWVVIGDGEEYLAITLREDLRVSSLYIVDSMTRRPLPKYAVEHVFLQQLDDSTWRVFVLLAGGAEQLLDVAMRNIPLMPPEVKRETIPQIEVQAKRNTVTPTACNDQVLTALLGDLRRALAKHDCHHKACDCYVVTELIGALGLAARWLCKT